MGRKKEKATSIPSSIDVQVIGNGFGGSPKCFMVNMDTHRYLFNCGEGTQRIALEQKLKISKLQDIFITHKSWDNIGGLLGMCLSLEGVGMQNLTLHGPPAVESVMTMSRKFAQLHVLNLAKREISKGYYEDAAMKVYSYPIYSDDLRTKRKLSEGETTLDTKRLKSDEASDPDKTAVNLWARIDPPEEKQDAAESPLPVYTEQEKCMSVAYVIKPIPKPRSVSLEKCVEVGIRRGPQVGILKSGQSVTLDDGTVIKPDDILEPGEPNRSIIVIECPDESYLKSLVDNKEMMEHTNDEIELIVHLSPRRIIEDPAYQQWMSQFPDVTKHMVINDTAEYISHERLYKIQAFLNHIHPTIYPLLPYQREKFEIPGLEGSVVPAVTGVRYVIRGHNAHTFCREQCMSLDNELYVKELNAQDGFPAALEETLRSASKETEPESVTYPEIIFLGTGSALPNKVRNVSAIWVNLSEDKSVLLDCGENTYGQVYRHFGEHAKEMLRKLSAIFISHLHADHHLGVPSFLLERSTWADSTAPLLVVAPGSIRHWYKNMDREVFPVDGVMKLIAMESLYPPEKQQSKDFQYLASCLDLCDATAVRVLHRQFPHGIVLHHRAGWSLAYSGDTMPCRDFAVAGQGVDILIHEATMEDDLVEEAKLKRHSTTSQAIDIGIQMKAKFILLTHFSQRYAKVPIFNENFSDKVGIAFDNMRVHRGNLHLLPHFIPALKAMFAEAYQEMEEKSQRKQQKKKLNAAKEAAAAVAGNQTSGEVAASAVSGMKDGQR